MMALSHIVQLSTRTCFIAAILAVPMLSFSGCSAGPSGSSNDGSATANAGTPGAEQAVGERLFLETRFAQSFKDFLDNGGDVNDPNAGDPVVDTVETLRAPIVNEAPFKSLSMNCRACHMVDEVLTAPGGGMRTYADFARRSPIPCQGGWEDACPAEFAGPRELDACPARRCAIPF